MKNVIKLKINGELKLEDGRKFTRLVGGFGEDKPMFTIWQAGELLGLRTGDVKENFDRNVGEFENSVDFVDLKALNVQNVKTKNTDITDFFKSAGITHHKYGRAKQWLAFSFSGMMKLVKIATTKESWEIYDRFLEDYFQTKAENKVMKKTIEEEIEFLKEQKAFMLGKMFMTSGESVERMDLFNRSEVLTAQITKLEKSLTQEEIIKQLQPQLHIADTVGNTKGYYDMGDFAKILGVSKLGRNNMFKWLREHSVLMKNNTPYQKYMQYFKVIPVVNSSGFKNNKTMLKPSGINYIVKKLIDDGVVVTKSANEILSELGQIA